MKPSRTAYWYVVLRYVHDIAAAEFVNVGVAMLAQDGSYVGAKFNARYGRVKKTFPTLEAVAFRKQMLHLQTSFDRIAQRDIGSRPFTQVEKGGSKALLEFVHSVLLQDDSSLQWSPVGSGLSRVPAETLTNLFQRFVLQYDEELTVAQRKDDDVWKCFRQELEKRNVLAHLEEKVIEVKDDSVKFAHAWKNGTWHCYEPLSFDLASDSSIREKAHRWLGQVSSVQNAPEAFQVFFLVGKPSDAALKGSYERAVSILGKAPKSTVIEEESASEFSEQVAREIESHESSAM